MGLDGVLWVYTDLDLRVWLVDNVLNAAQAKHEVGEKAMLASPCCKLETLQGYRKGVPSKVYKMKVSGRKKSGVIRGVIRGVIVCEHNNLMIDATWMQINLHGIVVLLVCISCP